MAQIKRCLLRGKLFRQRSSSRLREGIVLGAKTNSQGGKCSPSPRNRELPVAISYAGQVPMANGDAADARGPVSARPPSYDFLVWRKSRGFGFHLSPVASATASSARPGRAAMPASASETLRAGEQVAGEAAGNKPALEEEIPVHEEFTSICGAATQIIKCGPWKNLFEKESVPRLLFLVIPGNPGFTGYYWTFIQALYCGLNRQYPVWVVSHAGHCRVPHDMEIVEDTDVKELDDVFGLCGQTEHKLNFLRKTVPQDMKLVLIGHSIGCYIALEMIKQAPELEVIRCVMLFPTIERMAQSPQGKIMTPLLCQFRYIVYMPIYLIMLLPQKIKSILVRFVLRGLKHHDESSVMASLDLANMDCVANVMYLASQEMRKVVERDSSTIKKHLKKLTFYYGATDLWCPVQYYEEMKAEFPDGDIRLCEKGIRHAFVLEASKEVAAMVTEWVQDDLARL
ncbi:PREDICTED: lipid droplet-associated hydrolase [Gekko japonicus]|uniref:Lipid droplet-associated hydrolase n=1 Tax=Gekko japonicus TaxID=146911 RepID=A0ABM1JVS6_GEKJA|nr:PREDICTED: lipid droplet-associated hydrolase [Gekko japonicus]